MTGVDGESNSTTALGFLNQKLNFSKTLEKYLIEDDRFNIEVLSKKIEIFYDEDL